MFEKLKLLYLTGRISEIQLSLAVAKGWITAEQKQMIMDSE